MTSQICGDLGDVTGKRIIREMFKSLQEGEKMGIRLFLGGCAQGKLNYVLHRYHLDKHFVWDGSTVQQDLPEGDTVIIYHFHDWVKRRLAEGGCPQEEVLSFTERYRECFIICDEVGNGIVPGDRMEREYREQLGRMLVELAGQAETVERIICGIGQKIK